MHSTPPSHWPNARLMLVRSSIFASRRKSLTRSKTSNRPSRHPAEGVVVGPNIVGMAQPGATAAEERAVGAGAEEGDEAAHD
jgi:hypothetical protein